MFDVNDSITEYVKTCLMLLTALLHVKTGFKSITALLHVTIFDFLTSVIGLTVAIFSLVPGGIQCLHASCLCCCQ